MSCGTSLLPVVFISHGAGPAWYIDSRKESVAKAFTMTMLKDVDMHSESAEAIRNLRTVAGLPRKPGAILVISAHWEEAEHTVSTSPQPHLYFDYYGFPESTYKLEWPVRGEPGVAQAVIQLLASNGIKCCENGKRGLDHGVFVPLKLMYPEADVPVLQVSLKNNLSIADHLHLGEALQPLRAEGILIVGSGSTTHRPGASADDKHQFMRWFHDTLTNRTYTSEKRKELLLNSHCEPTFSACHQRIEHYLPSLVACAAADYQPGIVLYKDSWMSHVKFG